MTDETPESTPEPPTGDEGADAPSAAHTELGGDHPAGDGPRSDRDVGGPTAESPTDDVEGGKGTRPSEFDPHE